MDISGLCSLLTIKKGSSEKNIVRKNRFTIQSGALRNCYVLLRNSDLMARSYD